jgi:hypothetical protein
MELVKPIKLCGSGEVERKFLLTGGGTVCYRLCIPKI